MSSDRKREKKSVGNVKLYLRFREGKIYLIFLIAETIYLIIILSRSMIRNQICLRPVEKTVKVTKSETGI